MIRHRMGTLVNRSFSPWRFISSWYILTRLFMSYCLSLYGSGLWSLSSSTLHNIEVAFNKILRRIWSLPLRSHSLIVYLVANLHSLFNVIYCRSNSLLFATTQCPSLFVCTIFHDSSLFCSLFCGYNNMFGNRHIKQYYVEDFICAAVIRSLRRSVSGSDFKIEQIYSNRIL